jgi:hypothetical protein
MREFVVEKQSCNNITLGRANKIIYTLIGWRKILGPFESNTIADIYAAKTELETSKNRFGNGYKQNTIHDWGAHATVPLKRSRTRLAFFPPSLLLFPFPFC